MSQRFYPRYIPKNNEDLNPQNNSCTNVNNIIQDSSKAENTYISIN